MKRLLFLPFMMVALAASCSGKDPETTPTPTPTPSGTVQTDTRYKSVESAHFPVPSDKGDIVPDFSRVGYHWGDLDIPTIAVVATLNPPAEGADATTLIQNAINNATAPGAILLKKGVYNISGEIKLNKSGIVLRGEGQDEADGTVLIATGTTQRSLITMGGSGSRSVKNNNSTYDIKDSYVPAGRFWIRMKDASLFNVGDEVVIYRPSPQNWITDLKMDQIPPRNDGGTVTQWKAGGTDTYAERVITLIKGDTIHFENPVVCSLEEKYGGARVLKYTYSSRISECGVENMKLKSEYKSATDEAHGWLAIEVTVAQHCWVRNVTSQYFGKGLVDMVKGAKNISVLDCTCTDPISTIDGSRRYAFHISQGQLCLVKGCNSDKSRHDFVTGATGCGPNVFTNGRATNTYADIGPHQRWNSGTLYDNIASDGEICVQDRSNYGTGQGWAAVTNVLWNCRARTVIVQSPWVSGYNYSVGTIGTKSPGKFTSPLRPDGVWISPGTRVSPSSLYDAQLELRKTTQPGGVMAIQ